MHRVLVDMAIKNKVVKAEEVTKFLSDYETQMKARGLYK